MRVRSLTLASIALSVAGHATETENNHLRILPATAPIVVDGAFADWDLTAGIFAVNDAEYLREHYGLWFHAMYDAENLYILARWNDPAPLDNPGSSKGDQPFAGDCLQFRIITRYKEADAERVSHWSCWRDRDGVDMVDLAYGRTFKDGRLRDAQEKGAKQEFSIAADGKHYVQEISIPWSLLTIDGKPLTAGSSVRMALEPNYTAGAGGRVSIKDLFRPDIVPDRVFTFRAFDLWGEGRLLAASDGKTQPVRLADGRTFPVHMDGAVPKIDWTGLITSKDPVGFKDIRYVVPEDGSVSLNLVDAEGRVVRQLLTSAFRAAGEHVVQWDGLTTPFLDQPGDVVPAGSYSWKAIWNPGVGLRLRGFASNGGSVPWDAGPGTNWGGDHGTVEATAAGDGIMFLGWGGAEAGKALVACDESGAVRWRHIRGGMGGAGLVGHDRGVVFVVDHGSVLYRLDAKTGNYVVWRDGTLPESKIVDLWGKQPRNMPDRVEGMDAGHGKIYLTCAGAGFRRQDVSDWPALIGKIKADQGPGKVVKAGLNPYWVKQLGSKWKPDLDLAKFAASPNYQTPDLRDDIVRSLNRLLSSADLGAAGGLKGTELTQANRAILEAGLPELLPMRSNFLAVLDAASGALEKFIDLPQPRSVRAMQDGRVLVVVEDGTALVAVDPKTGTSSRILTGKGITCAAGHPSGRIFVGIAGERQQVVILDSTGAEIGTIGRKGGRQAIGPWQADGMRKPVSLSFDGRGNLWVAESTGSPKRVSVWDVGTGRLLRDFFGSTHYGASGGAIHPRDPDVMFGEGCEWRIDPKTGRGACLGVAEEDYADGAIYAEAGGRTYLALSYNRPKKIRIFERLGDGKFILRSSLAHAGEGKDASTRLWADTNGDATEQADEVTVLPEPMYAWGANWTGWVNEDLSIGVGLEKRKRGTILEVSGFTACNAPRYDLEASLAKWKAGAAGRACPEKRAVLSVSKLLSCVDPSTGKVRWTYPNTYAGVHGSHYATPPEPGLLRGAFAVVGTARLPAPLGTIWVLSGNCGEWYMFNEDGFFVTQLFQGDPFKQRFPDQAVPGAILDAAPPGLGGEDFGGHLRQGADGKVYIQAGKTALWNVEVVGLERIKALPGGTVEISTADQDKARQLRADLLQAADPRKLTAKRGKPGMTGDFAADWKGLTTVAFKKQDDAAVKAGLAWDDETLHVAWEVMDATPWINGADAPEFMYARGDTVDLQLATDPKANAKRTDPALGDLRISIGPFQGRAVAVVYRKVAEAKKPKVFSSGVVKEYVMDSVVTLARAEIKVRVDAAKRLYVVEAALPLAELGLVPRTGLVLSGDFGVTHGDASGSDTALRSHWSNRETGLVNDEVFELMMSPKRWGAISFAE